MNGITTNCEGMLAKVSRLEEYRRTVCSWDSLTHSALSPEELPARDRGWRAIQSTVHPWDQEKHTWLAARLEIPEDISGIEVGGSAVRLSSNIIGAPTRVFVDGVERFFEPYWADLRVPEVTLTESANAGQAFEIRVLLQNSSDRRTDAVNAAFVVLIERVEEAIFNLESFPSELRWCGGIPGLADVAGEASRAIAEEIGPHTEVRADLAVVNRIRASMQDAETFTKERVVHLVGHAHIDMNWLWPMEETIDICKRDFQAMVSLLETHDDFRFSQSQGAVYSITDTHNRELFAEIRRLVSEGRWDISTATTWTENDFNMSGPESIARHFLYTKEYLRRCFGKTGSVCWAPDTFGHPSSMPQILNKAGVFRYFHMRGGPGHTVYRWNGDGGSSLLVYNECYNGAVRTDRILDVSRRLADDYELSEAMLVYGVGDHGGGPTRRDIARARWLDSLPTTPRIRFSTPERYFEYLEGSDQARIPEIAGELNPVFEGCFTSQAETKRLNRECERRLLEAETCLALRLAGGGRPEGVTLDELWKPLLFNQFHDILCGCAVPESHRRAVGEMAGSLRQAERIVSESLKRLTGSDDGTRAVIGEISGNPEDVSVWNLQGFGRTDVVSLGRSDAHAVTDVSLADGTGVPFQSHDGELWFLAEDLPPLGNLRYSIHTGDTSKRERVASDPSFRVETDFYHIEFDPHSGCITELYDKDADRRLIGGRPWLANTAGPYPYNFSNNVFTIEYEKPQPMSAWVIGPIAESKTLYEGAESSVVSEGPLMTVLRFHHEVDSIVITQHVYVYTHLRRIDFHVTVSWPGGRKKAPRAPMLKVMFRPEFGPDCRYTCEVPYGVVERPRDGYEYPAQRWVDISDSTYGFALLNDSKYGFTARGDTLSMTCLRSSSHPDPRADAGEHEFRYAILPHPGPREGSDVFRQAVGFADRPTAVRGSSGTSGHSLLSVDSEQVLVSALKPTGDGSCIIIRLFETEGSACGFTVSAGFGLAEVEEISITEDDVFASIPARDGCFSDSLMGYELKTYRLRVAKR